MSIGSDDQSLRTSKDSSVEESHEWFHSLWIGEID